LYGSPINILTTCWANHHAFGFNSYMLWITLRNDILVDLYMKYSTSQSSHHITFTSLLIEYASNFKVFWCCLAIWVKTHYANPLWGTFGSSIIVHIMQLFQKHGIFNFGYQFWFLGLPKIIFTKLMLCNIIF
jgi:hypothetical protein